MCDSKYFSPSGTFGLKEKREREVQEKLEAAMALPPPPEPKEQRKAAYKKYRGIAELQRKLAASRGGMLLTGGLGLTQQANIGRKMLLGQ